MNYEVPFGEGTKERHEAAVRLLLTVLWRLGTGRPLFTVDGWLPSPRRRAACRWTVIALGLGLLVAPGPTPASVSAAGPLAAVWALGYMAGAGLNANDIPLMVMATAALIATSDR